MTLKAPDLLPWVTLLPPRKPPSWLRGATTAASGTSRRMASTSALSMWISRPGCIPR